MQTIYEFQHYIWGERKNNGSNQGLTEKNQARKANDHFMDCLRYIYNADPKYTEQVDDRDEEVRYEGEYVKYPVRSIGSSYHNLVEK